MGAAIEPGGNMHKLHLDFMQWAAGYDEGDITMRSHQLHEQWLAALSCPVLRIEGDMPTADQLVKITAALKVPEPFLPASMIFFRILVKVMLAFVGKLYFAIFSHDEQAM